MEKENNTDNENWRWERASICNNCDRLFKPTWTCRECGCFMKIKTKIFSAHCPLHKW